MYLCVCKGITEEQISNLQKNGRSFEDACRQLGLGTDCGICILSCQKTSSAAAHSNHHKEKIPAKKASN